MVVMNANGTIARCYNGFANTSSGNCAFVVAPPNGNSGNYTIDFGFQVNNRFILITPERGGNGVLMGANYQFFESNSVDIFTFITNVTGTGQSANNPFTIVVF